MIPNGVFFHYGSKRICQDFQLYTQEPLLLPAQFFGEQTPVKSQGKGDNHGKQRLDGTCSLCYHAVYDMLDIQGTEFIGPMPINLKARLMREI